MICIDAGHGGNDPGATNKGLKEKDIVLDISKKIRDILKYWGYETMLTRNTDEFIELGKRADIANELNAELFVSVHINAASTSNADGIETYHYPGSVSGIDLAEVIQDNLIKNTTESNRGVKEAEFVVLEETKMPAVLVELDFITNSNSVEELKYDYIDFIKAYSVAEAIKNYYK